jgi:uncharacterized protein YjbI with pentapeptide repeats
MIIVEGRRLVPLSKPSTLRPVIACGQRGQHVLCERKPKPMTDNNHKTANGDGEKTVWDKLAVIFQGLAAFGTVIAIPITVGYSVYQFKEQQAASASQLKEQQAASTSQTLDQQRQDSLDNYLNEMSNLDLNYKLSDSTEHSPVNAIAVAQTDTTVRNLDGARKGILIRYLWEADLITAPNPVITLFEIDLSKAVFAGANLSQVDLSTNHLFEADFAAANPNGADLIGADLRDADLRNANLSCIKNSQGISASIVETLTPANVACTYAPSGADLPGGANLSGANLTGADLRGTDLLGADLNGADLSGADLKGATYNSEALPPVKDPQGNTLTVGPTQWPSGFNPKLEGAIDVN